MEPIYPLDLQFDLNRLREALEIALTRFPFHPMYHQIALTHSRQASSAEERVYDGVGSLYDFEHQAYKRDPADFVIFNEDFKDLYFYEVYEQIREWSPLRLGRVRLMLRKSSSCYTMHADESRRYHLALLTNEHSYFFFKDRGHYQVPADGRLYGFEAELLHTGFNAGKSDRVHLVFDTIEWRYQPGSKIHLL